MNDSSALNSGIENIVKATIVGRDVQDPVSTPGGETTSRAFTEAGALAPPYEPETLVRLFEYSNSLRPNVDAYGTNIDGFGHRLDPAIDLSAEDADERVADCIFVERVAELQNGVGAGAVGSLEPTPDEVAARRRELARLSRVEKARLETFFSSCAFDSSFVAMRRQTRQDVEITGNAYWEVLRNGRGEIARLVYVPSYTMRLMPLDPTPVAVKEAVRISPVAVEVVETRRRLRRFVQIQGGERTFFKAYGDPRTVSRLTGQVHSGEGAVANGNEVDGPATEILHFAIPSSRSPYGVPRWIGALLSVLGSRSMEEVNLEYFEAKSVPPLALLVSGARLADESIRRIERFLEENIKGKKNFHKILVIEAEGAGGDGTKTKVEFQPLTSAQQQDQLFSEYDKRNMDKVGGAFRLPRILRGESSELNRSLAEASLRLAEDQVFQPERDEFDHIINQKLLGDMGIRFWRFKSQTPVTRDPERLTDMVEKLTRVGVLTPEEGRFLASDIFNREFAKLRAPWVKLPITLTLAGLQNQGTDEIRRSPGTLPSASSAGSSLVEDAKRLLRLREELVKEEERLASERLGLAHRYARGDDVPGAQPHDEASV